MNMGDDSRLMYDEIGERLQPAAPDLVDYFPFTDGRDKRIAELEAKLEAARKSFDDLWWFTSHYQNCITRYTTDEPCDCGLQEVVDAAGEWQE